MKKQVLIVSAEATTKAIMRLLLKQLPAQHDIEITEVMSCADGVAKVRERGFDVVITDNVTGVDEKTGFDVVHEVLGRHDGTKVILAAHRLSSEEVEMSKTLMPSGFLQKPFDPSLFTFCVESLLER